MPLHGYTEEGYIWVPFAIENKSHIGDLSNSLPALHTTERNVMQAGTKHSIYVITLN
jgi:hypothetical protein